MKIVHLLTAAAATALIGGAAYAQQPATAPATPAPAATASTYATAAPTGTATSTSVTATDPATGASVTNTLTTNGPVPDTPENRAKYGQPMSHAGKHTAPKGN
ncbi:MAG: hypothetical protein ACXU8S_16620 [Phenylobacterium sp.]